MAETEALTRFVVTACVIVASDSAPPADSLEAVVRDALGQYGIVKYCDAEEVAR